MASITSKGPRIRLAPMPAAPAPERLAPLPIPYAPSEDYRGLYESCLCCCKELKRPTLFVRLNRDCTRIVDPASDPKGAKFALGPECLQAHPELKPYLVG